jgi:hypothetical protein
MADLIKYRDSLRRVLPWWLQNGIAGKIVFALGAQFDGFGDAIVEAVKRRFPDAQWADSLPLIGRDRKIRRGSAEPDQIYAARLRRWLDDHRTRGNPYAMLAQLHAYYAQAPFLIELIYKSGRRYSMALDGSVTRDTTTFGDGSNAQWARWWLIYHWPTTINIAGKWGSSGAKWGKNNNIWGVDPASLSRTQVEDLRLVPTEWNAAHCQGMIILLGPDKRIWGYPLRKWGSSSDKWAGGGRTVRIPIGI